MNKSSVFFIINIIQSGERLKTCRYLFWIESGETSGHFVILLLGVIVK